MKIVILATSTENVATIKLKEAAEYRGHEVKIYNPEKMYLYVSNVRGNDRLYDGEKRIYKNEIDCVIPRIGTSLNHCVSIIQHIRENMNIFSTQTSSGIVNASNKLKTTQLLSLKRIKVPKTIYAKESKNVKLLIDLAGGLPVIVKGLTGSEGANVIILETVLSANSVLESYYKSKQQILIQEYIEPDKDGAKDIRAIVIGGKVVTSMQRKAQKGSFKANVSLGAEAEPIELTDEQKELCINASEAVGLDTSGVDLMTDKDGNNYIIEVNSNHGWRIQDICPDVNIADEYIKFCEENYKFGNEKRDLMAEFKDKVFEDKEIRDPEEIKKLEIRLALSSFGYNIEEAYKTSKRDICFNGKSFKEYRQDGFNNLYNGLIEKYGKEKVDFVYNKFFNKSY